MNVESTSRAPEEESTKPPSGDSSSYRFDIEASTSWLAHLRECGYVVVKDVASAEDVAVAKDLIWSDLEGAEGVDRSDPSTWIDWHLASHGIEASLAQTAGPWHLRGLKKVQQVFGLIWETDQLITSMDAVILWRPWWWKVEEDIVGERPCTEGLHLDQNPFSKPQLDCIQGMIPLLPVTSQVGGLEVVPFSHTDESKEKFKKDHPKMARRGDWCVIPPDSPHGDGAILLEAEPGDIVLWDSRTIHGGRVGPGASPTATPPSDLARMSVTVAMTPRALASEGVLRNRRSGFKAGFSFNHCPHEAGTSTGTFHSYRKRGYHEFELSKRQHAVL